MNAFHSKESLRAVRFIALLTPFEGLKEAQIQRIFDISLFKVGSFKRISSQFDVFIIYMLRKVAKSNEEILKKLNWEPIGKFIFEQILPGALKIPSPIRGARKIPKILNKSDVSLGEEFFESLGKNLPSSIAKFLVYMMEGEYYEVAIHKKLLFFLDSLRNLCHPSNHGSWSIQIEMFLGYFTETMAKKCKKDESILKKSSFDVIVEKIWYLSELLVFARSGPALSGLCISTFTCTNLANVRPDLIIPKIILSVSAALESVSEPHRTISAIGLLQVSMPKLLKSPLGIGPVLSLLPTVVFGIDSNDQLKSIRTLTLFNSFSESALIKDISGESFDFLEEWTDGCQEAKELTGQYPDIFLLFTENIISYLRTISQSTSGSTNEHEDLSRLILAISNSVYRLVSREIAEICLEKWLNLIEEDLGLMVTEIIGEISGKLARNHSIPIYERLIPRLLTKISYQIEGGNGQLGSKDQSNNSLNNNLIILSHLLETGIEFVKDNFKELSGMILNILNSITNRKSFLAGSRLFHSISIGLVRFEIEELDVEISGDPFVYWSNWIAFEDLKVDKDFKFKIPSETDGLLALEMLETVLNWIKAQVKDMKISCTTLTKGETEKLYCLLKIVDNLNVDLWNVYNNFGSYNYGINSDLSCESVAKGALKMFKENLNILISLIPIIESTCNLELEIQLGDMIGSVINGYPIHPDKSNEKLRAIKALDGGYKGVESEKKRPKSFLILQGEAQFKLRKDLRHNFGDLELETVLMNEFDELSQVLFKYCFKPYHMIRSAAQIDFRRFIYKYIKKARGFIVKALELVELNENLSESEFKGVLFLMRSRFSDIICEDFELIDRYLRCLLKLSEMPVSAEINESFEILSGNLNVFTDAFVPDERYDKVKVKDLVLDLMRIADEKSEKWTIQYLAMLSAHPLIEQCHVPELFNLLAKFSLSKVSIIRNIAQNCFKVAMFGHVKSIDGTFWRYRDLTALEVERSQKLPNAPPEIRLKEWTNEEFERFCHFFREYFKYLCLNEDEEGSDGSSLQFEYMNFIYMGRWINLFGPEEEEKFLKIVDELFYSCEGNGNFDLGKQRALCEIICAIICNYRNIENEIIFKLLKKSWNNLAIENLELWTSAIDEILMWKRPILIEIWKYFENSNFNETSKIILSIKMISIIFNQIGGNSWIEAEKLTERLLKLSAHEYTSIVMESGKLLALISLRDSSGSGGRILRELINIVSYDNVNLNVNRTILQFLACSSTIPNLTNYWIVLDENLMNLLKMLQSENVQMLTDAKKAIFSLFLAKGAELKDLNLLSEKILLFLKEGRGEIPVKISKFCIELIQLLLQNNFSLFHVEGSVEEFLEKYVNSLIESEEIYLREASHGITLTLYQIDSKKSEKDVEKVTKILLSLKSSIKSETGLKERHAMVIRGSAIVLSEPHNIRKQLPALLTALSYYISDRSPISPLVRTTFSEFRRTHQDTWQNDRHLFDEDQLDAIGELLIAPSYYA